MNALFEIIGLSFLFMIILGIVLFISFVILNTIIGFTMLFTGWDYDQALKRIVTAFFDIRDF